MASILGKGPLMVGSSSRLWQRARRGWVILAKSKNCFNSIWVRAANSNGGGSVVVRG